MPIPLIPLDASLREGTVYLNQAIEQANASELVRQEALAAIVLTEQATSAANTAAGNATTQANTANASAYAADLAATAALNARDGANTAATNANTARTNANTATTQANAARDGANTAKASADTAAANANAKAALADTSASTADAAATRANTAAEAVEDALADGPVISVNGQNAIVDLTHEDVGAPSKTYTDTELAKKVDKETGKGLFSGSYIDLTNKPSADDIGGAFGGSVGATLDDLDVRTRDHANRVDIHRSITFGTGEPPTDAEDGSIYFRIEV